MYCQSILTDKVHQPLATVRVVPLYQMCGRVAYLCVAFFAPYCKGLWEVCEFWMDFSVRTLPKWQSSSIHQSSGGLVCTLQYTRLCIAVLHLATVHQPMYCSSTFSSKTENESVPARIVSEPCGGKHSKLSVPKIRNFELLGASKRTDHSPSKIIHRK